MPRPMINFLDIFKCIIIARMNIKPSVQQKPFFSIVIPSLNEEKYLPKLLSDLASQTNRDFEVIHVDGSSEDNTVKIAEKFAKKMAITSYIVKKRNVSHQRNFGAKKAKGEWVVFMDSDNRLPAYFLDGIKYRLALNPSADIFTTWLKVESSSTLDLAIEKSINFGLELYHNIGREMAIGSLIGIKRKLTKEINFPEDQQVYEDSFFVQKATALGLNYLIFKDPKYYFSLRRLKKEGTLKIARSAALLNLRFLQGRSFDQENYGYVMEGGKYYDDRKSEGIVTSLQHFISSAPKKQLRYAKKLWQSIKELN